jgi:hypothetical protein
MHAQGKLRPVLRVAPRVGNVLPRNRSIDYSYNYRRNCVDTAWCRTIQKTLRYIQFQPEQSLKALRAVRQLNSKSGHESRGTRNQGTLRWRGPATL